MDNKGKKHHVLIVEDDKALLGAISDALTDAGYAITEAHNGEEGFQSAITQEPDVIIIDILMPKMDGMALLKKLREQDDYGKNVRVIILTNLEADDKMISDVVETQPTYYLIKSDTNMEEIPQKVKEVLED